MRIVLAGALVAVAALPVVAQPATADDPRVADFVEACLPADLVRPSFDALTAHIAALGWQPVDPIEESMFAAVVDPALPAVSDPDRPMRLSTFARESDGQRHYLLLTQVPSDLTDIAGCYIYEFGAAERFATEDLNARFGNTPLEEFDPSGMVNQLWLLPPNVDGVFEILATYVPEEATSQLFTGAALMARWSPSE